MTSGAALYRLLADDMRLRLLRLLAVERLNVTELTGILGIAQSGVSRHLGLLKEAGLVEEHRDGGFTYYVLAARLRDGSVERPPLRALLESEFALLRDTSLGRADDARLEEVHRVRQENFETHLGPGARERQLVPGRSWAAWARALGMLLPRLRVADIGCGEGYLSIEASRWASRVVAIDRSAAVLEKARALAVRRGVRNVTWKRGEIERLPIDTGAVDVALLSQALHHAEDPALALQEAHRVLAPGGRLLVLDLREHGETWVRDRLGDRWLGFSDERLLRLIKQAGFTSVAVDVGARRTGDPFTVLVAAGAKRAQGEGLRQAPRPVTGRDKGQ